MARNKLLAILVPIITFISGLFAQVLFDQWISTNNVLLLSSAVAIIGLVCVLIYIGWLETRFDTFETKLSNISNRIGLHVEYIKDGETGKSYLKSAELVEKSIKSVISIGDWEPFPNYLVSNINVNKNSGSSKILTARRRFYEALTKQVSLHQGNAPYYQRVVQVPEEYKHKRLPFEVDQILFEHLLKVSALNNHTSSLRKTSMILNLHFTIIDDRYIIIPILTGIKKVHQTRHGALFFDDPQGNLIQCLKSIYWLIEKDALPIERNQLELPPESISQKDFSN